MTKYLKVALSLALALSTWNSAFSSDAQGDADMEATEKVGVFGICWSKCDIFLKKRGHIRRFLQSFGFEFFVKAC